MKFNPSTMTAEASYKLLTGIIVPRPIAWVTTIGGNGQINAAPFSAFTFVSNDPPMIAINIGKRMGELKDTARNIAAKSEFTVNIADFGLLDAMHYTAVEHHEEVSEVDLLQLATTPGDIIKTPRITLAPISMECKLHQILEFGVAKSQLIIGEVKLFHIRDSICENGKVETKKLDPICRLGGPNYSTLGKIITMPAIKVTTHT